MARTPPTRIGASAALDTLSATGWRACEGRDAIVRTFRFADFKAAFGFMTQVALEAERLDHHPEWSNVYSTVEATLTTHDAGGVTGLDLELARFMDARAGH